MNLHKMRHHLAGYRQRLIDDLGRVVGEWDGKLVVLPNYRTVEPPPPRPRIEQRCRSQVRRLQTDWIRGDGTYDGMIKAKILRAFLVNPEDIAIDRTGLR